MQNFKGETASLTLPAGLNIRAMSTIKNILSDALSDSSSVSIEVADEAQVDLSFIQLIEAARVYAESCRKTIKLKAPASGNLLDVLTRGGFADELSSDAAKFWLHRETQ